MFLHKAHVDWCSQLRRQCKEAAARVLGVTRDQSHPPRSPTGPKGWDWKQEGRVEKASDPESHPECMASGEASDPESQCLHL